LLFCFTAQAQVVVAQLSDTHIGEARAPHAADNLRQAVSLINQRHPDAVILSGDIGETPSDWAIARAILRDLKAKLYYVPGNHDVHTHDVDRYRNVFGQDYYKFQVKDVTFIAIDSQLLGNFEHYEAKTPPALPPDTEAESKKMLAWMEDESKKTSGIVVGVQHIPIFRQDEKFPDTKPYWVVTEPYRWKEVGLLHKFGIKHMLVGHWHNGRVFDAYGFTWHVAPSTAWLPWGGELGFAVHTITQDGKVRTEFVTLPNGRP
jgi:3',5'-cyclic AMP phosphodiesterase CpdA